MLDSDPVILRRHIGYVFQEAGLFPHMTVAENIAITPRLLGRDEARIDARVHELLDSGPAGRRRFRRPPAAELSGGQRQRVALARALAARPPVMLLDEPFGALDPLTREAIAADVRDIHERLGLTTLMVTHDMTEALLMADRIAVMRDGRLVQVGTPQRIAGASGRRFCRPADRDPAAARPRLAETLNA